MLEKTPESPLNSKEIKPVNLKSDQPWIFTGRTDAEAEAELQYFGHLMQTDDSLEKSLMLGKIEGRRRRGSQRMRCLNSITDAVNMNLGKPGRWWGTGRPGVLQSTELQRVGHAWVTEQQQVVHYVYTPHLLNPFICWWTQVASISWQLSLMLL